MEFVNLGLLKFNSKSFKFSSEINTKFINIINNSLLAREYYARVAGGTSSSMKNVSREQIRELVIALPPIIEQNIVIKKVNELFSICDSLKDGIGKAQEVQNVLAEEIVKKVVRLNKYIIEKRLDMSKLIVLLYDNDGNKGYNENNLRLNFLRDSGLEPQIVLDQPTRDELINCLLSLNEPEDDILIHFISHGGERGISKVHSDGTGDGDIDTLIVWVDLIEYLNDISNRCLNLRVNLGNVCNSYHILERQDIVNFDVLVANTTVMNPVAPRKHNTLLLNGITAGAIDIIYNIYRN